MKHLALFLALLLISIAAASCQTASPHSFNVPQTTAQLFTDSETEPPHTLPVPETWDADSGALNAPATLNALTTLCDWLSETGFSPAMGQYQLSKIFEPCTYNGESPITGAIIGCGEYISDLRIDHGPISISNTWEGSADQTYNKSFTNFKTTVAIEGFSLPAEIGIGDSLSAVLGALGLPFDPEADFIPDKDAGSVMTLLTNETCRLTLERHSGSSDAYTLTFLEVKTPTEDRTKSVNKQRITFTFAQDEALSLSEFAVHASSVSVTE